MNILNLKHINLYLKENLQKKIHETSRKLFLYMYKFTKIYLPQRTVLLELDVVLYLVIKMAEGAEGG